MSFKDKCISFVSKNKKLLVTVGCLCLVSGLVCGFAFGLFGKKATDIDGGKGDPPSLSDTFGYLFGDKGPAVSGGDDSAATSRVQGELSMRPDENLGIPFNQTKLSTVLDNVDITYLYIQCRCSTLSNSGYTERKLVYGINGKDIYISQTVGSDTMHFLSDGEYFYGLDFELQQYTVISNTPYKASDLIYFDDFEYCSSKGSEIFFGETLEYEDFTLSVNPQNEWIRYYFKEDGMLAGYARYLEQELQELMYYEHFGSEFPDDAILFFDIPAGFTKYDPIVEWSDIYNDDSMD